MVDSIGGSGKVQGLQQVKSNTNQKDEPRSEKAGSSVPRDEVKLSEEALSLSQAEEAASEAREYLAQNTGESLTPPAQSFEGLL